MPDAFAVLAAALSGRYRIERVLGEGGMATVYLAQDLKHDRPVALKVLKPELAHALGPERFEREIKLAARLQHPHILTVLDSGGIELGRETRDAGGESRVPRPASLYFTMPYVEGESLRDRLNREKQLPLDDALRIAREAAQALQYAHEHGVVHRDIKPENLLLTTDGSTLVADFGIARALGGAQDQTLTQTGMALGTPAYMSPEQALADADLTARTDIYSLGAVLYEMLAGEAPFTGPTVQAVIARRFSGVIPSVRSTRTNVPANVDAAITKALAVVPADRWSSASEFARALVPPSVTSAVTATTVTAVTPRRRRFSPALGMLLLGLTIGAGVLFAWRRHEPEASAAAGGRRIAVLPFQNVGDSADAYFADGITDAVRGKLTTLTGLDVIAPGSSNDYRATTKSPSEIGHELGVDYLLEGKVRWAKAADGASRVQVSPMLIRASSQTVAWQTSFDASLTDVFQVQADIATQVAGALDVALGDSVKHQLTARPTRNLAAYDAFLRGEQAFTNTVSPVQLRLAMGYYEEAVALDSTFALAWAQLSRARSRLYFNGTPTPALAASAREAAERALALAPAAGAGHSAMGLYYNLVAGDLSAAAREVALALRDDPNDAAATLLLAYVELRLGRWDSALLHKQRAVALDPRSYQALDELGDVLIRLRRYPEARAALDRALALAPSNLTIIEDRTLVELGAGQLAQARAMIAAARGADAAELVTFIALYQDLYWVLDDAQQRLLLAQPPAAFDQDRGAWGIVRAQTFWLRGDTAAARSYADSARLAFTEQLRQSPQDAQRHVFLGLALAYLGRYPEAIAEGKRATALLPVSADHRDGPYMQHQLVRIYLLAGEPEQALDYLEPLLTTPYFLSPGWLRIDPTFAPLEGNPRFEKLVARGG